MQNGILYGSSAAYKKNSAVTIGTWSEFLEFIETNCVPAFLFWGNTGCSQCESYINNIIKSSTFTEYISNDGKSFAYYQAEGTDDQNKSVKEFAKGAAGAFPYVRLYWKKSDGQIVSKDISRGSSTYAKKDPNKLISDIQSTFSGYTPLTESTLTYSVNGGTGTQPSAQTANTGSAITLSSTRLTKTGYTHIGWKINGSVYELGATYTLKFTTTAVAEWKKKDVEQDTATQSKEYTIPVFDPAQENIPEQGYTGLYKDKDFPVHHSYDTTGKKYIRISDNLSSLCVRGNIENGIERQIKAAYISRKIPEISPSCFMNCAELTAVNADNSINTVDDYAFYGCSSLKGISFLGKENKQLKRIGDYAFAKSGLESIIINHKGSVDDSAIHSWCFASCDNLEQVEFTSSTYLGAHMFDGCKKLQKVTLNNYHSYVSEYCFANCPSLTSISLPEKTYMLSPHMFEGCTNLTSINFDDNAVLQQCGDAAFSKCTKLTSITLPASVSSLSFIDSCFLSGSSVSRVEFKGIDDEYLANAEKISHEITYETGKIYNKDLANLVNCAAEANIPLVAWLWSGYNQGCANCDNFYDLVIKPLTEWFSTTPYLYASGEYKISSKEYSALKKFVSKAGLETPGTWVYVYLYWKKSDGTVQKWTSGTVTDCAAFAEQLKSKIAELFSGYTGEAEIEYKIKEKITTFGRGEGFYVTYVSKTGREYVCYNDSVEFVPETKIDHDTTDNFKYGIWYYNARELKEFADENNLPVMFEYSSSACDPCRDFRKSTFMNETFQAEIRQRPCLFCRVEIGEGEYFDHPTTTQAYYLSHELNKENTYIPCIIYYWKKSDTETVQTAWNYNYRSDPANANYETVLAKLDSMLGDYSGEDEFWPPDVNWSENEKFQYYENETSDDNGRYFICDTKKFINKYTGKLEIDVGSSTITLNSIEIDQLVGIPDYTYQYYTTSSADAQYNTAGILFKVENGFIKYIYEFANENEIVKSSGTVTYQKGNLYSVESETGFKQILTLCQSSSIPLVLLKSGVDQTEFDTSIKNSDEFKKWLKNSEYIMVEVRQDVWTSAVGEAVQSFETETAFHGNSISDPLPKLLAYHGCSSCTADGRLVIYCRRKIAIESGKDVKYYTGLLDSYAEEYEDE